MNLFIKVKSPFFWTMNIRSEQDMASFGDINNCLISIMTGCCLREYYFAIFEKTASHGFKKL